MLSTCESSIDIQAMERLQPADMNRTYTDFLQMEINQSDPNYGIDGTEETMPQGTMLGYIVHILLSSVMYAFAGTIFYKRSFNTNMFPALVTFLYMAIFAERLSLSHPLFTALCLVAMTARVILTNDTGLTSSSIQMFLTLFLSIVDMKIGFLVSCSIPYESRIIMAAVPQFIRKPNTLKARLQNLRSKMGPLFVMYVTLIGYNTFLRVQNDIVANLVTSCLAVVTVLTSCLAGIVFRPDNKAVAEFFYPNTITAKRRAIHGILMVISLGLSVCLMIITY